MARMRKCPFCEKEVAESYPHLMYNQQIGKWVFDHWCEGNERNEMPVVITVYGKTEQEVIDRWNGVYEEQESESL